MITLPHWLSPCCTRLSLPSVLQCCKVGCRQIWLRADELWGSAIVTLQLSADAEPYMLVKAAIGAFHVAFHTVASEQ